MLLNVNTFKDFLCALAESLVLHKFSVCVQSFNCWGQFLVYPYIKPFNIIVHIFYFFLSSFFSMSSFSPILIFYQIFLYKKMCACGYVVHRAKSRLLPLPGELFLSLSTNPLYHYN